MPGYFPAERIQPWLPGSDYRQGEQQGQQNALVRRDANMRYQNALAQQDRYAREKKDWERVDAVRSNPNATADDYMRVGDFETANALRSREVAESKRHYYQAKYILQSSSPKALIEQEFPDDLAELKGSGKFDWDTATDDQVKDVVRGLMAHHGSIAGIGPDVPLETIGDVKNPAGGVWQRDPVTGEVKQITAPHYSESGGAGGYSLNPQSGVNPQTGKPDQFVTDKTGRVKWLGVAPDRSKEDRADVKQVQLLRKEYEDRDSVKNYQTQLPLLLSARNAPDTRAGDIDLMYAVGKIFDPQSVVREGELQLTQGAASWLVNLANMTNSQMTGKGRLSPSIRREILKTLNNRVMESRKAYDAEYQRYADLAGKSGYVPQDVVGRHFANRMRDQPSGAQAGAARISSDAEFDRLPSGAFFIGPDGQRRQKP